MSKKINLQNINNFLTGNTRQILDNYGVLAPHLQEQVKYRLTLCQDDCVKQGACKNCGCTLPGRAFATPSCEPKRFPDLMNEEDWNKFKIDNNIE